MNIRIESKYGYPGPTEYEVGKKIENVWVFVESLPREANNKLTEFQLSTYKQHGLRVYTVYGDINLLEDHLTFVLKSPKKPPPIVTSFWGQRVVIPTPLPPPEANIIFVSYSRILRQKGLNLIMTHDKVDYPCTLVPPVVPPSYESLRIKPDL